MRRLRLLQLLLCLAFWARLCDGAANKTCLCEDVEKLQGLYIDRPCNECASGYYRTCTGGSYYAHHPTMCIYTSRQNYAHDEAGKMCVDRDVSGFPAFVKDREESYHISHYVWNMLKNGVEGDETFFWVGGKYKLYERTNQTFWLFEYRGYYDHVPRELLPDNATLAQAIHENRTCLAGHTELHTKLYPRHCDEKLPAVCYNYRQTAKHFCEQVAGKTWSLFQGKCYYVYSAPSKDRTGYISYFDAQQKCIEMNSILATVTDEPTFNRTLELATGLEEIVDLDDGTWIGLQVGGWRFNDSLYYFPNGTKQNFTFKGEYGEHMGWWEDGTPYNHTALEQFWAPESNHSGHVTGRQPNEQPLENEIKLANGTVVQWGCSFKRVDQKYVERCERVRSQHCTQIFPGRIADSTLCLGCAAYTYKWNDRWCYYLQRGYICQRDADSEGDRNRLNDEL